MSEGQATGFSREKVRRTVLEVISESLGVEEAGIADDMYILKEGGSPNLGGEEVDLADIILGFDEPLEPLGVKLGNHDYDQIRYMTVSQLVDFVAVRCCAS